LNNIVILLTAAFFIYCILRCLVFVRSGNKDPDIQIVRMVFFIGFGVLSYCLIFSDDADFKKSVAYYAVTIALLNSVDAFFTHLKEKGDDVNYFYKIVANVIMAILFTSCLVVAFLLLWLFTRF